MHADSSNFKDSITKTEALNQVLEQAEALCDGQRNWVSSNKIIDYTRRLIDIGVVSLNDDSFFVIDS